MPQHEDPGLDTKRTKTKLTDAAPQRMGAAISLYETSQTIPETGEQTGQPKGRQQRAQKTRLGNRQQRAQKADPQTEETLDSSVHRCQEEAGADAVLRHEVPQVERRQG